MMRFPGSAKAARVILALVSAGIILLGIGNLLNGRLEYLNHKGFYLFGPFAILAGLLGLIAAFRPKSSPSVIRKSGRIRGWPTTKTRDHRKPHQRLKSKKPTY
jgi:hypothetical protein